MDNLKNFGFTELNPSEMKQIQGGNLIEDIERLFGSLEGYAAYLGITIEELRKRLGL